MTTSTSAMRGGVASTRLPPHTYFVVSAVFHYLGPAFAVLLFARMDVLGAAWLRIATAAVVFAAWRVWRAQRSWRAWGQRRAWRRLPQRQVVQIVALGAVLGVMNCTFYVAIDRMPLGTVGAIEFLGPVVLAAAAVRTGRNALALGLAVAGVALLADVHIATEPIGLAFAFANAALFVCYVSLAHRLARDGGPAGVDRLGSAMIVAVLLVSPVGASEGAAAFGDPALLAAGVAVGVCSSVVPYVCDQLAMARLPRATFAFLLALLPATATVVGLVVLHQMPTTVEVAGVLAVVAGVALRREPSHA